jgi:hypothetical protein
MTTSPESRALPRSTFVTTWIVSAIHILLAFWLCIFADDVTLHLEPALAAVGLGLGFGSGFAELINNAYAPNTNSPKLLHHDREDRLGGAECMPHLRGLGDPGVK